MDIGVGLGSPVEVLRSRLEITGLGDPESGFSSNGVQDTQSLASEPHPATTVQELMECPVCTSSKCQNTCKTQTSGNFRTYNCPYPGSECPVTGDIAFLVTHLKDDHKADMHTDCKFTSHFANSNPRWIFKVFNCFGQYFCLYMADYLLGKYPVYKAFIQFMGDEEEARSYTYILEVGGNESKVTWKGSPSSITVSHKTVKDTFNGLAMFKNMGISFSDGKLTGSIWKGQYHPQACV